jgi:hypothetical protein
VECPRLHSLVIVEKDLIRVKIVYKYEEVYGVC